MMSGCGSAACHGGARPAQGLDLSNESGAYAALVDQASTQCGSTTLVKPGDPDASYLVTKLDPNAALCGGSRMPKTGAAWTSSQLAQLRAWIGSGAAP